MWKHAHWGIKLIPLVCVRKPEKPAVLSSPEVFLPAVFLALGPMFLGGAEKEMKRVMAGFSSAFMSSYTSEIEITVLCGVICQGPPSRHTSSASTNQC